MKQISSIILAAGKGSRMGHPKALLMLGEHSFLDRLLHTHFEAGIRHTLIVIQAQLQPQVEALIKPPNEMKIEWVYSEPQWPQLASLQRAVEQLSKENHALLIGPVDQGPYPASLLHMLLDGFTPKSDNIRIPVFEKHSGHPVLIGADFISQLMQDHPQGLRGIFSNYSEKLEHIPLPYPAISRNLNTREQYETFVQQFAAQSQNNPITPK